MSQCKKDEFLLLQKGTMNTFSVQQQSHEAHYRTILQEPLPTSSLTEPTPPTSLFRVLAGDAFVHDETLPEKLQKLHSAQNTFLLIPRLVYAEETAP